MSQFDYRYGGNMTKIKSIKAAGIIFLLTGTLGLIFFQNCSNSVFNSEGVSTTCTDLGNGDLSCVKNSKAFSSTSTPFGSLTPSSPTSFPHLAGVPSPPPIPAPSTILTSPPAPPPPVTTSASTSDVVSLPVIISGSGRFNFVAGDKAICENSIQTRLGISASCVIGAGCGLSCGAPNGTSCVSANPTHPGSCISVSYGSNTIGGTITKMFNFADSDKAACELSISKRFGLKAICATGGGCNSSCGIPNGTTCVSDNPSLFGACIKAFIKTN